MQTRRVTTPRPKLFRSILAGVLVAILSLPLVAAPAQATYASQGAGRFTDSIFWFEWNNPVPNTGSTQTNSTTILDQEFVVTCSIANMARLRGTGAGNWLAPYRPGGYGGDMLDDLYNRGGVGAANQMQIGLYTSNQGNTIEFDFSCSATLGGQAFPLEGLVMADSESTASNETIAATIASPGTWRILDRARSSACATQSILATRTVVGTNNRLTLGTTGECIQGSPVNVAYMDGVTVARDVTVAGGGREAIALGVVAGFESSDAPGSFGAAAHGMNLAFTGGEIPLGQTVRTNDPAFTLATPVLPSPRLGSTVDPDATQYASGLADADDLSLNPLTGNANDEDGFTRGTTMTVVPGQTYSTTIPCVGPGTLGAWIDWDRSGAFDADERAQGVCAGGSVTPVWTIPADAVSTPSGQNTFMRLRIAATAAAVASPSSVAPVGEVEDHIVRVVVPQPAATTDTATTPFETAVTLPVLANDVTGGSPFVPGSVRLLDGATPVTSLTTAQGTFVVDQATGEIRFTPATQYVGTTPAVGYRVTDVAGRSADSTLTVTVLAPPAGQAADDTTTGNQGTTQRVNPLANDTPGATSVPLDPDTLTLLDADGDPVDTLTVPGQGVYAVVGGEITFTPEPTFVGAASGVRYSVADEFGVVVSASYVPTVLPVAVNDTSIGLQGVPQTIDVRVNDTADGVTTDPATLQLIDPAGDPVDSVTVPGEGVYTVVDGAIRFTPEPAFVGNARPIAYQVGTNEGGTIQASLVATVTAVAPVSNPETTSGPQGVSQTVDPFANDDAGDPTVPLDRASLTLLNAAGEPVDTLAVAGGTYEVDGSVLRFTPDPTFSGIAPTVSYRIADVNGTTATSTYSAVVRAVAPIARGDVSEDVQGATQRIDPLANDDAGDPAVALDPASLTLVNAAGEPVQSITVAGVGEWSVEGGELVFVPEPAYSGTPDAVTYRIADVNGTTRTAPWSVEVVPGVSPDVSRGLQGQPQQIDVMTNDADDVVPTTLLLVDPADGALRTAVTIDGEGVYEVINGGIVFTPELSFRGAATPILYDVEDEDGNHRQTPLSVSVDPVDPRAEADVTTGPQGVTQSTAPLANDEAGADIVPLDPASLTLLNDDGDPVDSLSVAGGEYRIEAGRIIFTPEPTLVGSPQAATYRIADANGTTAVSTYTPAFTAVTPTATTDEGSANQGTAVAVDPFDNDASGDPAVALDPSSLTLVNAAGTPVEEIEVDGQGTYSVDRTDPDAPRLVFTPLPTWVGTATPASYRIADVNGTTATAAFFPTLIAVTPIATPDEASARQGAPVRVAPLENDTAGATEVPLDAASLTLVGTDGTAVDELVIDGEGTYTVDRTDPDAPVLVFTPLPTWVGAANPATYRLADANGTITESTFTPTLTPVTPTAAPDEVTGLQGAIVAVEPLIGDAAGDPAVPLDPTSLTLLDAAGNATETVVVDGQGTYTVDRSAPDAPRIVFTPVGSFTGTATAVGYRIADANGTTAASTFTPTLTPVTPTAAPDSATARQGAAASVAPLANDTVGAATVPFVPGSLTLLTADGVPASEIVIDGEGRYTIDSTDPAAPRIVFTPLASFTGEATAVDYRVSDANGTPTVSTFTPTITAVTPVAQPDVASARQGAVASVNPVLNDAPGGIDVPLVGSSVTLLNADGRAVAQLPIDGQGTYSVDRTNPDVPRLVFTPLPSFAGEATPASYRIADANGTTTVSTFTPTITAVDPIATPDQGEARQGAVVSVEPLDNDAAGLVDVPLVPGAFTFVDADGNSVDELEVAGQGTWSVDRSDADVPVVTFTPLPTFVGTATVNYRVADANGTFAPSTISAIITAVTPTAAPDAGSARQGAAVSVDPLLNDAAGDAEVELDPTTLTLLDGAGNPVTEVVVDGQGTYSVDRSDADAPRLVFTPLPTFSGEATPVSYRIADANGTTATSTFTPTITAVIPVATADTASARQGASASAAVLANDAAGDAEVPLDPATLTLIDADGNPVSEVIIDGQGTYTVDVTNADAPRIVFTPLPSFTGSATPVDYRVADENGTTTTAVFTPRITAVTPIATPDTGAARQGAVVSVDPLLNDAAGTPEVPLEAASMTLLTATGVAVDEVTIAGQGTYSVDRTDVDAPRLVFTPLPAFVGEATPVSYRVADANGTTAESTFTPTITNVTPIASPDSGIARQGAAVSVEPLDNDTAGLVDVPLVPGTFTFVDADGNPVDELEVAGQGTWSVDRSDADVPVVTFTPLPTFVGTATVNYRVADANGTFAPSTISAIITAVTPTAAPDAGSARQGAAVSVDPLLNDAPGDAEVELDPTTLTLLDGAGNPVTEVVVDGQGTYSVDRSDADAPRLVFTPLPTFSGEATPVSYRIADANGTTATSTFTPTITAVSPVATADTATTRQGAPVSISPLANDAAGNSEVPLEPATLTLLNADGAPVAEVVVAGEGRWTIDRSNPDEPVMVFTPEPGFAGIATPVAYRVADTNGTVATAEVVVTVTAVTPIARPDTASALQGTPVSVDPFLNDDAGDSAVPLDADSLTLLDGAGNPVVELVIDGQGTYSVDRSGDGPPRLVFTPLPSFSGEANPASYRIADENGTVAVSTFSPTITAVIPVASNDSGFARQGAPVTLDPLLNDRAGDVTVPLDSATLTLLDGAGNPVDELVVAGQGRWTIDRTNPAGPTVTFTPEPGFVGSASVNYRVADANGTVTEAVIEAVITAVTPVATADSSTGTAGQPQSVDPLANDMAGNSEVPLDPATLTLVDTDGALVRVVVVPGEGRYELVDGRIVFTPEAGFIGIATGVRYQVADTNGTVISELYVPTVTAAPVTVVDTIVVEAERGTAVSVDPGANVADLDPRTVRIIDAEGAQVTRLDVPGEGVWLVDPETGFIMFTPEPGFEGDPTPIRWIGATLDGDLVSGEIDIRYVDAPVDPVPPLPTEPTPAPSEPSEQPAPGETVAPIAGDDLPATGATTPIWLIVIAAAMSAIGVVLFLRRGRNRGEFGQE